MHFHGRGSSPRGRGTRLTTALLHALQRFIPAWAGNTGIRGVEQERKAVHPRVGGEHQVWCFGTAAIRGSSPRGRGTRRPGQTSMATGRFIPAWAGNTFDDKGKPITRLVHPRVGGEHSPHAGHRFFGGGSSPRGRGTRHAVHRAPCSRRFIPAWAGNTAWPSSIGSVLSVHPRVGGEHRPAASSTSHSRGSSPRGRGTPTARHARLWLVRFIPAWAGNTPAGH